MRLSPLFSRPRVAPEPHGANSTDTTPSIADASTQHPLSQAPKSAVAQGTPKSHRGMLASARKSLASLRKQLPLMCMSSATLKAVENPPPRTQQMHGRQTRVDERRQPPMPHKTERERMQRQEPQQAQQAQPTVQLVAIPPKPPRAQQLHGQQRPLDRRMQPPVPQKMRRDETQLPQSGTLAPELPTTPKLSRSSVASARPQLRRTASLRSLDRELAEITQRCSDIQKQVFMEYRKATPEEKQLLKTRKALITQRNELRDSRLDALLVALAPMEDIPAPRTTTSGHATVQMDVMQHNRREVFKARGKSLDKNALAENYARAKRHLESLNKGDAPGDQIQRLQRLMHGYQNMLALEQIVRSTDDQLERLGAPRLMAGIPTTAEERRKTDEKERDAHQEAIDNGYF